MQLLSAETKCPLRYSKGGISSWKLLPLVFLSWCFGKSPCSLHIPKVKRETHPSLQTAQSLKLWESEAEDP